MYLGIGHVYGAFNVTPERVGIDQATMFGRLIAAIILGVLAGALLLGDAARGRHGHRISS